MRGFSCHVAAPEAVASWNAPLLAPLDKQSISCRNRRPAGLPQDLRSEMGTAVVDGALLTYRNPALLLDLHGGECGIGDFPEKRGRSQALSADLQRLAV
jgi:hypothetical protein